jgi:hypothetical protein
MRWQAALHHGRVSLFGDRLQRVLEISDQAGDTPLLILHQLGGKYGPHVEKCPLQPKVACARRAFLTISLQPMKVPIYRVETIGSAGAVHSRVRSQDVSLEKQQCRSGVYFIQPSE